MSRAFHYKTPHELAAHAAAMGLELPLEPDLGVLFTPIEIGGRRVGNRLAILPMEGCDAQADGAPGELTLRRFERLGAGGAKLIWGEACAVVPEGRANPRQLWANQARIADFAHLVSSTRRAHRAANGDDGDLLIGLQLTHSGRYSFARPLLATHDPLLDPRTVLDRESGARAGPDAPLITDSELDRLQDHYLAAARLAQDAGFDFVDLKQCHRYLLNELLGARARPGKYGGPFENRTRFIRDLVARLRHECPRLLIATRVNAYDGVPFEKGQAGLGEPSRLRPRIHAAFGAPDDDPAAEDPAEPLAMVRALVELGLALVCVTAGNPYASPHLLRPFEYPPPDGYEPPEHPLLGVDRHFRLTAAFQHAFPPLPVVGSGYSWLQAYAFQAGAANVAAGRSSLVGIGRGALSQPDFARRLAHGEPLDRKRICRTFSLCTALMRSKHNDQGQFPAGCPPFDKAVYGPIWEAAKKATEAVSAAVALLVILAARPAFAADPPLAPPPTDPPPRAASSCDLVYRGNVWFGLGDFDQAMAAYSEALKLAPGDPTALLFRARAWTDHMDFVRAIADYSALVALDPSNAAYRLERGRSWSRQGRHAPAIADLNAALTLSPRDPEIWLARGIEWRKDIKFDAALADFEQAIVLDPAFALAYLARGQVFRQRKQPALAIAEYERLLVVDPESAPAHEALARILATSFDERIRNGPRAVAAARAASETAFGRDADYLDTLAAALAEAGDYPAAVKTQNQALAILRESAMGRTRKANQFDYRLALYQNRRPARE